MHTTSLQSIALQQGLPCHALSALSHAMMQHCLRMPLSSLPCPICCSSLQILETRLTSCQLLRRHWLAATLSCCYVITIGRRDSLATHKSKVPGTSKSRMSSLSRWPRRQAGKLGRAPPCHQLQVVRKYRRSPAWRHILLRALPPSRRPVHHQKSACNPLVRSCTAPASQWPTCALHANT